MAAVYERLESFASDISSVVKMSKKATRQNERLAQSNNVLITKIKAMGLESEETKKQLQHTIDDLTDKLSDAKIQRVCSQDECVELKLQLEERNDEFQKSTEKVHLLQEECRDLKEQLSSRDALLQKLKTELSDRESKISRAVDMMKTVVGPSISLVANKTMIDNLKTVIRSLGCDWELFESIMSNGDSFATGSAVTCAMLGEEWISSKKSNDIDIITFNYARVSNILRKAGYQCCMTNMGRYGSKWHVYHYSKLISGGSFDIIVPIITPITALTDCQDIDQYAIVREMVGSFDFTFAWNYFDGTTFRSLSRESLIKKVHYGDIPESSRTNATRKRLYCARGFTFSFLEPRPAPVETIYPLTANII